MFLKAKRYEHRFSHRENHLCSVLVDERFQPFHEVELYERVRQGEGLPFPKLALAGTGVWLLLGGASVLLGLCPAVGIILLIVFMLGTTFSMHNFWTVSDPQMKQADMINFLKNMALLGAQLMLLAVPQPWSFSGQADSAAACNGSIRVNS
jgi:putative oxidoreductase